MSNSDNPKVPRGLFGYHLFVFLLAGFLLLSLYLAPYIVSHLGAWNISGKLGEILYDGCQTVYEICQLTCHQRPDRSFFICGIPMPLCIRCVGMAFGTFFAACVGFILLPRGDIFEKLRQYFFLPPKVNPWIIIFVLTVFAAPMILDGFAQLIFPYDSADITRFLTGLIFGYFRGAVLITVVSSLLRLGKDWRYSSLNE